MQDDGEISDLELQKEFMLIPKQETRKGPNYRACKYVADFCYMKDGERIVEDVKGYRRGQAYALFTIKKKLMKFQFDIEVEEI